MNYTTLRYEKADRIALVTFSTPDNLNGIDEVRLDELEAVLDDCAADEEIGALILTGEGKAFCVGLDLDLLDKAFADLDYFDVIVARVNGIITRLENLDIPTISAHNGFTRAGGFEIALGCDFMIVADEAKIGDVHTDAGVVPAAVTLRLRRRVGDQRAKEILWTARWYKGQEAVEVGLALKSVPLANLMDEATALARSMVDKPRPTIAALKRVLRDGLGLSVAEGAALELKTFGHYNRTQPYGREGYTAFREKRVPSWKVKALIRALLLALALLLLPDHVWAQAAAPSAKERCEALAGSRFQKLEGAPTYVTSAQLRPEQGAQPENCLVEGYVNPTVAFAIVLPAHTWNGRYMVRGCGGSCGRVVVDLACARHLRDGFACLHTDMGHRSTLTDNNWVPNNLQGLVDFGYRATHVTAVAGKAIIKAFYSADPAKSYFFACSTGGRQGLIEAQRFPDDFDGIVAIAPASMAPFGQAKPANISDVNAFNTGPDGRPILPNRKTLLIHAAVLKACDKRDGLIDGLISAPLACPFKPSELLCKTSETSACLTAAQVAVAEKMYTWRGTAPGSELRWIGTLIANAPLPGEDWTPIPDLGADRGDPATIETLNAPNNPDLRPFRNRGGKLILVQGWSDAIVAPAPTLDYYQTVQRTMGGAAETGAFARLFMIPGMEHCTGGDGAWAIDYVAALTGWVERGEAPAKLRGIHPDPAAQIDYFSTNLPDMDPRFLRFARDHHAWPGISVAVRGMPTTPARGAAKPLVQAFGDAAEAAVRSGTGSGYARRSVLNLALSEMWQVLAANDDPIDVQRAALASLATTAQTPLVVEAARRLQAELLLD